MEVQTIRPRIKLSLTLTDKLVEICGWLCIGLLWWETFHYYPGLPDTIPVHYGFSGNVDAYGSKRMMLTLPTIATILFLGISLLNQFPHIFNYPVKINSENAERQYRAATRLLRYLKLLIPVIFGFIESETILSISSGSAKINGWFFPMMMGLIFIPLIVYILLAVRSNK